MIFGKKNNLVGLDIGSSAIKVGELLQRKNGLELKSFGIRNIPHGTIEEGEIIDPSPIVDAIKSLFKELKIKNSNVAISVGGYSVIVKTINLRTMTTEELQEVISFEAEQYLPYDLSEINLDYQIIGSSEASPDQMGVLIVAARKEVVGDYISLVTMAGLNPCLIDVDSFALQNAYEKNCDADSEKIVAVIDMGASKASINILKGTLSMSMMDLEIGGFQINEAIIDLRGCTPEESEKIKRGDLPDELSVAAISEIEAKVVSAWCSEIKKTIQEYEQTAMVGGVEKILLSGGGSNNKRFQTFLSETLGVDVEIINPFKGLIIDGNRFDPLNLDMMASQASICLGLALRKMDDK